MNQPPLKFFIRNSKRHSSTREASHRPSEQPEISFRATIDDFSSMRDLDSRGDLSDRISKLQGNLKILEQKYRENLKEGFDNKIKAYRFQAVVERKILRQAVEETQKCQEMERAEKKTVHNEHLRQLS
jgi:hypothetical protein